MQYDRTPPGKKSMATTGIQKTLWTLLLLWPIHTTAQEVARDTTIAGQTYALLPADVLIAQLRSAGPGPRLHYTRTVFSGPLFARAAGIDTVRAALDFSEVRFLGEVSLDQVVFLEPVHLARTVFAMGLSLMGTRFLAPLDLSAAHFRKQASFKQAAFLDRTDFSESKFYEVGSFIETQFHGPTSFSQVLFKDIIYFEGADFSGPVDFQDAFYEGIASFKEAVWQRTVSFSGAHFRERVMFWQARFAGGASFDTAWFGDEVSFSQARFATRASFHHTTFEGPAHFDQTIFRAPAYFVDSRFQKDADFIGARFHAGLHLNAFFNTTLDLRHIRTPLLDLQPPAEKLPDMRADSTFADTAQIYLQGAHYQQILARFSQLQGRLATRDATLEDLAPVYASLRRHLQAQGLNRDASACRVEWLERRRHTLNWTEGKKYWLQLLWLSSGYLTDLWRLVCFAFFSVLLFSVLFRLWRPSLQSIHDKSSPSFLDCLYLSVQIFIRLGPGSWHATGPARLLIVAAALLGWICWALFIATFLSLWWS